MQVTIWNNASKVVSELMWRLLCPPLVFIPTHKDTFRHIQPLTSDKTSNRKENRHLLVCSRPPRFAQIVAPAVIKPGSHFLSFCIGAKDSGN